MKTYIALFRGINVGGNHMLPMKELKAALTQNGGILKADKVAVRGCEPRHRRRAARICLHG